VLLFILKFCFWFLKAQMTHFEKSSGIIVLQYEWKLNGMKEKAVTLSNEINYKNNGSFRAGFKKLSNASLSTPTLIFMASNLNKIGLKVESVSFSSDSVVSSSKDKQMDLKIGKKKLQLFTARPIGFSSYWSCTFKFTVYLVGIIENYRVNQTDNLLSQQLLSSAIQDSDVDFNLIAENGKRFPVHKWMIAARSPVFATIFSEEENDVIVDCNEDVMKQFVKFIYTGEFDGFGSHELIKLAVKYKIKTLEDLCQAASKEASWDEITRLIAQTLELGSSETDYVVPV